MYIYLDFVPQFACAMCGSCCRNAWQVTVDEDRYRANAALFARTGRAAEFAAAFQPLTGGAPGEYAAIAKRPDGGCWFLADDNHCRLHREAGHDHLDGVCRLFPRYPVDTARGTELTLSFSCPEVVRLASRPEPLQVVRSDLPPTAAGEDDDDFVAAVFPGQQPPASPLRYYFELEHHFIDIMQARPLPLAGRLALLRRTVTALGALGGSPGDSLRRLVHENYDRLDALPPAPADLSPAALLTENYFVSLIFKKIFYLSGLERAMTLLESILREIAAAGAGAPAPADAYRRVSRAIMAIEFRYSHTAKHRTANSPAPAASTKFHQISS